MKRLLPLSITALCLYTTPVINETPTKVSFTIDQALYIACAHVSRSIITPNDGTMVRLTVATVENGIVYIGVGVWMEGRSATKEEVQRVASSIETKLEGLVKLSLRPAGLERYVRGVRVIPIGSAIF